MVKIRAYKVLVVRDETTRIPKVVWEWELPILEAAHREGFVIRAQEKEKDAVLEVERDELPDAAEEYDRLTRVYGADDGGRDLTELVFGYRQKGIAELEKTIKGSVVGKAPSKVSKTAKTKADNAEPAFDPLGDED